MASYIGSCVENPFGAMDVLINVVDNYANQITKRTFLKHSVVPNDLLADMLRFPADYQYFKSKDRWSGGNTIYFYSHSAIEYFYV